jgi:hypothetical protein
MPRKARFLGIVEAPGFFKTNYGDWYIDYQHTAGTITNNRTILSDSVHIALTGEDRNSVVTGYLIYTYTIPKTYEVQTYKNIIDKRDKSVS